MVTPVHVVFSTEVGIILLSHKLIEVSSFVMDSCLCQEEIFMSFVLKTFNDMLLELHQDKTFCKSFVKDWTRSLEWFTAPIVVSSANMSALVSVSESGRSFTYIKHKIGPSTEP